jgi:Lecithin retinol acyltransferase
MAKGDHIRVNRYGGIISHHGIDMGDGSVVHFRKNDSGNTTVDRTSMADFAKGGEVKAIQHPTYDRPNVVVSRAKECYQLQQRGEIKSYHLFERNCEHLATYCKTGVVRSEQVENAARTTQMAAQSASRPLFSMVVRKLFGG